MSDVSKPIIPEEIQKQINAKYSVILDKLKAHDQFGEDIKRLSDSHDLMFSALQDQDLKQKESVAKVLKFHQDAVKQSDLDRGSLGSLSVRLGHLEEALGHLREALENFIQSHLVDIGKVNFALENLSKKSAKADDLHSLEQRHNLSMASIDASFAVQAADLRELKVSFPLHQGQINKIASDQDDLRQNLQVHKDHMTSKIGELGSIIHGVLHDLNLKTDVMNQKFSDDLKGHKDYLSTASSSFSVAKDELNNRMNVIALDSANAVSRSENIEQQIKLLDKKIDKAILMFNKYELSK